MHSSRMHTVHSNSCWGVCLSACLERLPRCGPGDPPWQDPHQLPPWVWAWRPPQPDPPQLPPWVWAWRSPLARSPSTSPLGVGLETPTPPHWPDPPQLPPGCGPGNLQGMLGYHHPLETCCKACWDTTCNTCWDTTPSPVNRILDTRF